jgi:hypothetical protein
MKPGLTNPTMTECIKTLHDLRVKFPPAVTGRGLKPQIGWLPILTQQNKTAP